MRRMLMLLLGVAVLTALFAVPAVASGGEGGGCEVYLSDMIPLYEQDVHVCMGLNSVYWMPQIIIDNVVYTKGVTMVPPDPTDPPGLFSNCRYATRPSMPGTAARAAWKLDGKYETFSASLGLAQEENGESTWWGDGAIYRVYLDDVLIYDSGVVWYTTPLIDLSLNVEGGNTLTLEVDAIGYNWGDNAVWANARVSME